MSKANLYVKAMSGGEGKCRENCLVQEWAYISELERGCVCGRENRNRRVSIFMESRKFPDSGIDSLLNHIL